ncbi:MAG: hypothetical protein K8R85_17140 [Bacteroidetes bacterium]|nr:hypothetical protein [Bacteroidota bacterium]
MKKYKFFLLFIFITGFAYSQSKQTKNHGTIKISKVKPDSIYIKTEINFLQFQEGNKTILRPINIPLNRVIEPFPKVPDNTVPFDYNQFCTKKIKIKKSDLGDKISDTIRIQIKILDNGKGYYKDLTPLMVLNGVPAFYDEKMHGYKLDAIHWKCLSALKEIKQWEPAYTVIEIKEKFKKVIVIKQKKKYLSATGILTIVFSSIPFEELEY